MLSWFSLLEMMPSVGSVLNLVCFLAKSARVCPWLQELHVPCLLWTSPWSSSNAVLWALPRALAGKSEPCGREGKSEYLHSQQHRAPSRAYKFNLPGRHVGLRSQTLLSFPHMPQSPRSVLSEARGAAIGEEKWNRLKVFLAAWPPMG